uniref:HTH tetR-type domain-containing protein n=1 Tax=Thermosporothrix sp. COM3 TaxID=2490863 RepID=A0A455SQC5_9CHLR|nr:hypothetical protein KTC_46610 [Thermosporothrix sp. COM3]
MGTQKQRRSLSREEVEETRRSIIRVASQLFMQYGYRAVSTRQIADTCGLTQPALYHHFADKQDLYIAVVKERLSRTRAGLERIVQRQESVQDRLRLVVRFLLTTNQHDISMMLHDIAYELDKQAYKTLLDLFQGGIIAPIASLFADGIQQGILRDQEHEGLQPMAAAEMFMHVLKSFVPRESSGSLHPTAPRSGYLSEHIAEAERVVPLLFYGLAYPDFEQAPYLRKE